VTAAWRVSLAVPSDTFKRLMLHQGVLLMPIGLTLLLLGLLIHGFGSKSMDIPIGASRGDEVVE